MKNRYAVSLVFKAREKGKKSILLYQAIIEAASEHEAIGIGISDAESKKDFIDNSILVVRQILKISDKPAILKALEYGFDAGREKTYSDHCVNCSAPEADHHPEQNFCPIDTRSFNQNSKYSAIGYTYKWQDKEEFLDTFIIED